MRSLHLEKTEDSPKIFFDAASGKLLIKGRSYMEDPSPFQQSIISWLRDYFKKPCSKTILELELDYVNTSSTRMLLDILDELKRFSIFGNDALVKWRYYHIDEDMKELGYELREMVDLPFDFEDLA